MDYFHCAGQRSNLRRLIPRFGCLRWIVQEILGLSESLAIHAYHRLRWPLPVVRQGHEWFAFVSCSIVVSAVVCFPKSRLERWLRFLRSRPLSSVWNNVLSLRNLSYLYWLAKVKCHIICVKPEIHACFQGFRLTMMLFSVFLSLNPLLLCIVVVIPSWYLLISLYK